MVTVLNSLIIILQYYQTILIKNTITIPKYYLIESESPFLILVMRMEHLVKLETQHLGKKHVLHNKTHMTIISFWVGAALVFIQLLQFVIWFLLKRRGGGRRSGARSRLIERSTYSKFVNKTTKEFCFFWIIHAKIWHNGQGTIYLIPRKKSFFIILIYYSSQCWWFDHYFQTEIQYKKGEDHIKLMVIAY